MFIVSYPWNQDFRLNLVFFVILEWNLTVKNMGHLPLMKRHFIEGSLNVQHLFFVFFEQNIEEDKPKQCHCQWFVFLSIDVFWFLPWRWNDSTRVFTNMLFLFLGHVKSYSFWACTMLFWTFHLGRAKRLSWPNRVKPLAMRHQICCFVHFLATFHFGRMNVFGVSSSFFHACCSEAQNSET